MDSKNSLKLVFLLFSIFIVHLFLYYFFPSYGNYFKNIKYDWNIKTENEYASEVNDNKKATIKWVSSYTWSNFVIPDINSNENEEDILIENENNPELVDNNNEETNKILDENNTENTDIILDDTWKQEIFDLFSDFNLEQKEKSKITSLFGLTNEYPYDFEEYY
jgi:hypothetical protein